MKCFILLLIIVCSVHAQTAPKTVTHKAAKPVTTSTPTPTPTPMATPAMSPEFKSAAIDAVSCLSALQTGILDRGSAYSQQKMRCDELVNKCQLLVSNEPEKKVYGPLGLLAIQLDLCRTYAESGTSEKFKGCLDQARKTNDQLVEAIRPRPTPSAQSAAADVPEKK